MSDLRIEFDSVTAERNRLIRELADANARADALAAEVERLTAELTAHRTDTLRLHDEMRAHHAAELALAAGFAREEIAALRARLAAADIEIETAGHMEISANEVITAYRAELAALRAQLDAAGEWRAVSEAPPQE